VNPIYWDLGDGIAVRTYTPDDAVEAFALVEPTVTGCIRG
jgi:hypothetical protein